MALSQSRLTLPEWQSRALMGAGLAALAAAAFGSGVYAFQSASVSQLVYGIPTDAVIKTTLAVAADVGVALGAAVTAWLYWSNRKGLQRQAIWAAAATALAFTLGVSNLSGYYAWTRGQHAADAARASPLHDVAVANAERVARGEMAYLTGADRRLLEQAQAPSNAVRESGDVGKAIGLHILVLLFGFAYRLPAKRKAKVVRKRRAQGKPKLVVSNH